MDDPDAAWESLRNALSHRGFDNSDTAALGELAGREFVPLCPDEPLLACLRGRLEQDEFAALLATVAEAIAFGPRTEPFASTWRALFEAGCPWDRLWRALFHACHDPTSDPQDEAWLPREGCFANARQLIERGFPFRESPAWPGIGAHSTIANATAGAKELIRLDAPLFFVLQNVAWARPAVSPAIGALADSAADLGKHATDSDEPIDRVDPRQWFAALTEILARQDVVYDPPLDRFCFSAERSSAPAFTRRHALRPPAAADPGIVAMLARNRRYEAVPWDYVGLDELEWMHPIRWLAIAGQDAVVESYLPGDIRPVLRPMRRG